MEKGLLIADCVEEEIIPLLKGLKSQSKMDFNLEIVTKNIETNVHRNGAFSDIRRYVCYFQTAWKLFRSNNKYEIIICWQQFYALICAFYCNLFHSKKDVKLFACNFTYKSKTGWKYKPYRWFMKKCLTGDCLRYIHVPSDEYANRISEEFGFPRERIVVTPFGVPDEYDKYKVMPAPKGETKEGYFCAIGRSNRDYDFLMKAWGGVEISTTSSLLFRTLIPHTAHMPI